MICSSPYFYSGGRSHPKNPIGNTVQKMEYTHSGIGAGHGPQSWLNHGCPCDVTSFKKIFSGFYALLISPNPGMEKNHNGLYANGLEVLTFRNIWRARRVGQGPYHPNNMVCLYLGEGDPSNQGRGP